MRYLVYLAGGTQRYETDNLQLAIYKCHELEQEYKFRAVIEDTILKTTDIHRMISDLYRNSNTAD